MCKPIEELYDPDAKCYLVNVDYLGEDTVEAVAYAFDDGTILFRHLSDVMGHLYRGKKPTTPMMRREFGFRNDEPVRFRLTPLVA